MDTKKIRNLFHCITGGYVRFDHPLVALLSAGNRSVCREPLERKTPRITLGPRNFSYFLLVAEQFLHVRCKTFASLENLANQFLPRQSLIHQTVGHEFTIPLAGGGCFSGELLSNVPGKHGPLADGCG